MSCTSDAPSRSLRESGTRTASKPGSGILALAFTVVLGGACTGQIVGEGTSQNRNGTGGSMGSSGSGGSPSKPGSGSGGSTQGSGSGGSTQGGDGSGGSMQGSDGSGGSMQGSDGSGGSGTGGAGTGGAPPVPLNMGGVTLRLLTQSEYLASVQSLLGTLTTPMDLADDTSVAGFAEVGATQMSVTDTAATAYETASLAATTEVFADSKRWQTLVGCTPKADLSDACVTTYIKTFGRKAFRRDLTAEEVQQWLGVAQNAATLAGTAATGLSFATAGMLQSPNFLYRVETNKVDPTTGRLKYDGLSMANRLSYALTGGPPSTALLDAAAAGKLDTADGVRAAAAPLLADPAVVDHMVAFFSEYAQAQQVLAVSKSTTLFPTFTAALQSSMLQGTQLFLKNVVLAPGADVRSFYDSNQTFVDAKLAPIYGVKAPTTSGFSQVQLPATSGRAGILGQAAVIAAQSQPDRTSPTRRGIFILESLLCTTPPSPPPGVVTDLTVDTTLTTRQQLEAHRSDPKCAGCHTLFDPMGLALEHFDPIGKYRDTENGLPIDATGTMGTTSFDGEAQLATALRQNPAVLTCLLRNFYRSVNGRAEDDEDLDQILSLGETLSADGYAWTTFLADFVASDAFRSAPALPIMTGSP